jgi:hypothetical protein
MSAPLEAQGISLPRLGLGTFRMQGAACQEAVESALALGYRHCWMLVNNTLHKAYDAIAGEIAAVPFSHAATLTRDYLVRERIGSVLLLGTRSTMEHQFFAGPLNSPAKEAIYDNYGNERLKPSRRERSGMPSKKAVVRPVTWLR